MEKYTPERTWSNVEVVVIGALAPQRRLFTPWPAWDYSEFVRKLARGSAPCTVPHPNRLHGWYQPTGMGPMGLAVAR